MNKKAILKLVANIMGTLYPNHQIEVKLTNKSNLMIKLFDISCILDA